MPNQAGGARTPSTPATSTQIRIGKVTVYKTGDVVRYTAGFAVDADGCPSAYHPPAPGAPHGRPPGLDDLRNAGSPGNWYGLVTGDGKRTGTPVVQVSTDVCPGFYVSPTSLQDRHRQIKDPRRYVDSKRVPYVAVPPELLALGVKLGDFCDVARGAKVCSAIVADVGPRKKVGEGSVALAQALGIPASPINGGCDGGVSVTIFLRTSRGWPVDMAEVNLAVAALQAALVPSSGS